MHRCGSTRTGLLIGVRPAFFWSLSDRGGCRPWRLRSVELSIALFDATSPLVPGYSHANMVRASSFACNGDFLLRLAVCQGENLIAERRRGALASSGLCGRAPACSLRRGCRRRRSRRLGSGRLSYPRACAVARQHTLGRFQFAELAFQLLALRVDARQRVTDPLFYLFDFVQCRHVGPSRQSRLTGSVNLFGVYHYNAYNATAECPVDGAGRLSSARLPCGAIFFEFQVLTNGQFHWGKRDLPVVHNESDCFAIGGLGFLLATRLGRSLLQYRTCVPPSWRRSI